MDMRKIKNAFYTQRKDAKRRGIDWEFSGFEEWLDKWEQSGKLAERGQGRGMYCMCRYGDAGPYSWSNTFMQTHEENVSEAHLGRKHTKETKEKMKGRPAWNKGKTGPNAGKKMPKLCKPLILDGVYYESRKAAAEAHNVTGATIRYWIIKKGRGELL